MTGPLAIVINPAAGGGAAARSMGQVAEVLNGAAMRYTVLESKSLDHARSLAVAAADAGDTVVAVGGDGMAGALAGALAGRGARAPRRPAPRPAAGAAPPTFGVIPCGRGNDFARTHRIPFEPAAAARVLLDCEPRPVDLIEVTRAAETGASGEPDSRRGPAAVSPADRPDDAVGISTVVAGSVYLGIIPVAGEIANRARLLRGPVAYNLAALRALIGWQPTRFRMDATGPDGEEINREFRGYCVVAANAPYFGGGMKAAPGADTGDGLLDIVLMRHAPKVTFLRALAKVKNGSHVDLDQIEVLTARSLTVSADRALPAGADGESLACAAPLPAGSCLRIRVLPGAVRIIAPS